MARLKALLRVASKRRLFLLDTGDAYPYVHPRPIERYEEADLAKYFAKVLSGRVQRMDRASLYKHTLIYLGLPPKGRAAIRHLESMLAKCLERGDLVVVDNLVSVKDRSV